MPAITYQCIHYKNENRILVQFQPNTVWNKRMRKVPGVSWSKTYCGWTIPDTTENRIKCNLPLPVIHSTASPGKLAATLLPYYQASLPKQIGQPAAVLSKEAKHQTTKAVLCFISEDNKAELQKFLHQLYLKAYSPKTITTYRNEFSQLLYKLGNRPAQHLQPHQLQRYILYCITTGLSEHTIHSRINALKFYYAGAA